MREHGACARRLTDRLGQTIFIICVHGHRFTNLNDECAQLVSAAETPSFVLIVWIIRIVSFGFVPRSERDIVLSWLISHPNIYVMSQHLNGHNSNAENIHCAFRFHLRGLFFFLALNIVLKGIYFHSFLKQFMFRVLLCFHAVLLLLFWIANFPKFSFSLSCVWLLSDVRT